MDRRQALLPYKQIACCFIGKGVKREFSVPFAWQLTEKRIHAGGETPMLTVPALVQMAFKAISHMRLFYLPGYRVVWTGGCCTITLKHQQSQQKRAFRLEEEDETSESMCL